MTDKVPDVVPWPRGRCEYQQPGQIGYCGARGRWMVYGFIRCGKHKES